MYMLCKVAQVLPRPRLDPFGDKSKKNKSAITCSSEELHGVCAYIYFVGIYRIVSHRYKAVVHSLLQPVHATIIHTQ